MTYFEIFVDLILLVISFHIRLVGKTLKQFGVASFVAGKGCNSGQTGWFQPFMYEEFIYPPNYIQNAIIFCCFLILFIGGFSFAVTSGLLPMSKLRRLLKETTKK